MINIGKVTVLLSMNCGHTTNTPGTIVTTPCSSMLLIRVSKHRSVTKLTTIEPSVFSCTYKTTYTYWYVSMLTIALFSMLS